MHFIPRKVHGFLDYITGALLLLAPSLLGFQHVDAARNVAMIMGAGIILYSLCTAYELGLVKALPFSAHLGMDALGGVFLAASPWIFGFADQVYAPHLLVGLMEIAVVLFTSRASTTESSAVHHREVTHH